MKFPEKMWFLIILNVTRKQGFSLSLENTIFEKATEVGEGGKIDPSPSLFRVKSLLQVLLWFMGKMTAGTENLVLFIKQSVLFLVFFLLQYVQYADLQMD